MRYLARIAPLAAILTVVTVLQAQDAAQWNSVQALRKGARVGVIQSDQKRVEGTFESATDSRITIQAGQPVSIEKADVVRVYQPAKHGRVFGGVIGCAVGVTVGAILDGTVGVRFRNEGDSPARGLLTVAGAGVGTGIGVAATGGYRTIYRRPK